MQGTPGKLAVYSDVDGAVAVVAEALSVGTLGGEMPGLHDGGEPGVELFVGCHLVEKAAVDEPDFAGVAHCRIASEEHCRGHTVDRDVGRLVLDTRGLVDFEFLFCDLRAAVGRDVHFEADVVGRVLQCDGDRVSILVVRVHLQVRRIIDREVILLVAARKVPGRWGSCRYFRCCGGCLVSCKCKCRTRTTGRHRRARGVETGIPLVRFAFRNFSKAESAGSADIQVVRAVLFAAD